MTFGLLVDGRLPPRPQLHRAAQCGFDAVALSFWEDTNGTDWGDWSAAVAEAGLPVTALGVYGNPLGGDEAAERVKEGWTTLVREAPRLGARLVSGFAGRVPGASVPDSIEPWKRWFAPVAEAAAVRGVTVAFETCRMGGTWKMGSWNLAYAPRAWELMEAALPAVWNLEWEPGHAILGFGDPLAQLEGWWPRVVHLHAKDGTVDRDALARHGAYGGVEVTRYCLPGQGDTDWAGLAEACRNNGFRGAVDLELPPAAKATSPVTDDDVTAALAFLRRCFNS